MEDPSLKHLKQVYSAEEFREQGHAIIDLLAEHLHGTVAKGSGKAIQWNPPDAEYTHWHEFLLSGRTTSFFADTLARTTHIHHPGYIGHQVAPPAPLTALTGLLGSLLNNGMAVYEMGMAPTAMERIVTEWLCERIGWGAESGGLLTSGGSLANLTALLAARKARASGDVWTEGMQRPLGIMVGAEAHYCVDRAARIMGLGTPGIIKVPVDRNFRMDTTVLEDRLQAAEEAGIEVFAIVGSAPSTATGSYDDLEQIGRFAQRHGLWFHADGAHGGSAILSKKYHPLLKGIEHADSVVIDGHKMMMMPTITTALLFRDARNANGTFNQKADYLLDEADHEDWFNGGKRTFECTKSMMSLHWYALLKFYGESVFDRYITTCFDKARTLVKLLRDSDDFEPAMDPMSNIVCFRYRPKGLTEEETDRVNERIRLRLLQDGRFYIVRTRLQGREYLRTSLMNLFTSEKDLQTLLVTIRKFAPE